jgi:hypothetical protein
MLRALPPPSQCTLAFSSLSPSRNRSLVRPTGWTCSLYFFTHPD